MKHLFLLFLCCLLTATPAFSTIQMQHTRTFQPTQLSFKERLLLKMLQIKTNTSIAKPLILNQLANECAKIVLKNGDVIEADISEITPVEVKYKRCGKPNDPLIVVYKKDVLSIKASDGETIFRNTDNAKTTVNSNGEPSNHMMAVAALVLGILSLLISVKVPVLVLAAAILAILFGATALKQIKQNPEKYKGKGIARAGLILGIITTSILVLLLANGTI